jgi:hypothetical protein
MKPQIVIVVIASIALCGYIKLSRRQNPDETTKKLGRHNQFVNSAWLHQDEWKAGAFLEW